MNPHKTQKHTFTRKNYHFPWDENIFFFFFFHEVVDVQYKLQVYNTVIYNF